MEEARFRKRNQWRHLESGWKAIESLSMSSERSKSGQGNEE